MRISKVESMLSASLNCLYECVQIPIPVFIAENRYIFVSAAFCNQVSIFQASFPLHKPLSNKPLVQVVFLANALIEEMRVFYSLWRGYSMKGNPFRRVTEGYGFLLVVNPAVDKKQCAFREGVIWSGPDPGHGEYTAHEIRCDGHLGYSRWL